MAQQSGSVAWIKVQLAENHIANTLMTERESFNERRRQNFLSETLYKETARNQQELIRGEQKNLLLADSDQETASVHHFLYLEAFWAWMLDYTSGLPLDELAPRLSGIVNLFEEWNETDQLWMKAVRKKYPEDGPYEYRAAPDFNTLADYEDTLQLLSIAILLRDENSVLRIIDVLRSHRGLDALFECLISAYKDMEETEGTCVLGKPFDILSELFYADSPKQSKILLERYLKKWYPAMKYHPRWYDGHLKINKKGYAPYYGYWAFEAAAAVYLLDLDDSRIEHLVYPKDLVAYGKMLRAQNRYTSESR
ncbi:PoNe immunity protein domain-containing protein [Undibacterium sp. TJN25]|uniref:PoNe immunity protein domain-containing protein n=1 Tax=Undibacterium sp. TJN25 TaxID=3413056 RepID=UPI003BEFD7CA